MYPILKNPKFKYTIQQPASNPLPTLKIHTLSVYPPTPNNCPPELGGKLRVSEVKLSLLKLYRAQAISTELMRLKAGGGLSLLTIPSLPSKYASSLEALATSQPEIPQPTSPFAHPLSHNMLSSLLLLSSMHTHS